MHATDFAEHFPHTAAVVQQGIERGLHHGAQIYISQRGSVLVDVGLGQATPNEPMTAETVLPWLSAGKPLTAVLIGQLVESGLVGWDDPVAKHVPEFCGLGKAGITLRHLLSHTAGLGHITHGWPDVAWQESLYTICAAELPPNWIVGETAAYDPQCSWFLLGEIIQRRSGQAFADALRDRVLLPAGMNRTSAGGDSDLALPNADTPGWMWERQQGQLVPTEWHAAPRYVRPSPGSSLRGPVRELGRFYEQLLHAWKGDNTPLISAQRVSEMTTPQRVGRFDQTFGHIVDFGLGFLLDSNRYGVETVPYGYGRDCSPQTFGHGGSQSSQGYCDPARELVVAYVFNGRPSEGQHQRRVRALHDAVSKDLKLNGE